MCFKRFSAKWPPTFHPSAFVTSRFQGSEWSLWLAGFPDRLGRKPWPSKIFHALWICPSFLGMKAADLFLSFGGGRQWTYLSTPRVGLASLWVGRTRGVLKRNVHLCESIIKNFIPSLNTTRIVGFLSFWHLWRTHKKGLFLVNKRRRLKAYLCGGHHLWGNKLGGSFLGCRDAATALNGTSVSFLSCFRMAGFLSFWVLAFRCSDLFCVYASVSVPVKAPASVGMHFSLYMWTRSV